jgi:hypothetical protein
LRDRKQGRFVCICGAKPEDPSPTQAPRTC